MGGITTQMLPTHEPRICSAAALCGHWDDLLTEAASDARWETAMALNRAESQRRLDWLSSLDPVKNLKLKYVPRPLLMACEDLDTDVPKF